MVVVTEMRRIQIQLQGLLTIIFLFVSPVLSNSDTLQMFVTTESGGNEWKQVQNVQFQNRSTIQLRYLNQDILWLGLGKTEEHPRFASFRIEIIGNHRVGFQDIKSGKWMRLYENGSLVADKLVPSLDAIFTYKIKDNKVHIQGVNGRSFEIRSDGCFAPVKRLPSRRKFAELAHNQPSGRRRIRSVCLGGWLVIEGWIKPSLFDGIQDNDLLDGAQIQLQSVTMGTFVSAEGGGGQTVAVNRRTPSTWETFRIWRVTNGTYQFRVSNNDFMSAENGGGGRVTADRPSPSTWETFNIVRSPNDPYIIHIKALNGMFLQATNSSQLTADYTGQPDWTENSITFKMYILEEAALHGEFQLANGYHSSRARAVFKQHRKTFVTAKDFKFLSKSGIDAVRIPVGWWLASDPEPPAPYVAGSLRYLDKAFKWARQYGIQVIVDLHAAPGSQNGLEHSSSRDGTSEWAQPGMNNIEKTIDVINFIASRYGNNPALLGIELLNEPFQSVVPLDVLTSYYKQAYQTIRMYSSSVYVIMCQRIGTDPHELWGIGDGLENAVLDLHYYNLFEDSFDNMTVQQNIDFVRNARQSELQSLNGASNLLTFVGEWVNEWKVWNASKADYQAFGSAQLQSYAYASFGWSYWTIRNAEWHWDFEWNVEQNYLQQLSGSGW